MLRRFRQSAICNPQSAILMFCLLCAPAAANNIRVANVLLQGQDTNARTVKVAFDLAWDNSWRGSENWDAAWVFVKFRAPGSNEWEHAALSPNAANHFAPDGAITVGLSGGQGAWGTTGLGVFVYSSANHTGNVNYTSAKLQWNYGSNGYAFAKGTLVEVSVHALEMVYIPEGAFHLGSGGGELSHFYQYTNGVPTTQPYLVTSENNAIPVGTTSGYLYYDYYVMGSGDRTGIISNAFPKGYAAFYCMKYEISQGQYADFLNKLTYSQATNRFPNLNGYFRHTISPNVTNYYSAARPDRACNCLAWADGIAYADWAALRPMTELEFEKACRGPSGPVSNEYAWGTTNIMPNASRTLSGAEDGTETVTNSTAAGGCNYGYQLHVGGDGDYGPLRVGIFATNNATRISSGASYYGVLDLCGSLWEQVVSVGNSSGRIFRGTHGDGVLAANGNPVGNADWPAWDTTSGSSLRGGSWDRGAADVRVSDRSFGAYGGNGRENYRGFRNVRSAP